MRQMLLLKTIFTYRVRIIFSISIKKKLIFVSFFSLYLVYRTEYSIGAIISFLYFVCAC